MKVEWGEGVENCVQICLVWNHKTPGHWLRINKICSVYTAIYSA